MDAEISIKLRNELRRRTCAGSKKARRRAGFRHSCDVVAMQASIKEALERHAHDIYVNEEVNPFVC
ncbi:hypothetical protein CS542_05245 [Pedobacter sp. IW39]|nr:hypothetical protein CS542_05245 [Pedobacter sp. IW39]